jgi:uncharacterized protein
VGAAHDASPALAHGVCHVWGNSIVKNMRRQSFRCHERTFHVYVESEARVTLMAEEAMRSSPQNENYAAVKRYADAWLANDLRRIVDCYHDEVVFHYFGRSPLAGTHQGKLACLAVLKTVREKTNRQLVSIQDVLAGEHFGLIVAVERFDCRGGAIELERLFRYRVRDGKLAECWVYDEDQQLVDECWA